MLSKLQFFSLLAYTSHPAPGNQAHAQSRDAMYAIKMDRVVSGNPPIATSVRIAKAVAEKIQGGSFPGAFGADVTLVPVTSTTLLKPGSLWVPYRLANALQAGGLGSVRLFLRRTEPLPKAAFQTDPKRRPSLADQVRTLTVDSALDEPKRILLVDDIITSGTTLLACADRLAERFAVPISGFAAMRTISNAAEFRSIEDPCVGSVTLRQNGKPHRVP